MLGMSDYGIGNTTLMELEPVNENRIFIKLERENFLGSIKARTGYWIIDNLPSDADNKVIIESTSGNLGLALGFFCRETNRKFLCLVDSSIAIKKLNSLEANGIEYEMVTAKAGLDLRSSRIKRAEELMATGDYYWVNQYDNPFGVMAHQCTTAPEIWEQTNHQVTHVVCSMGSCGTICGISRFLKEKSQDIKICGVEPLGSTIFGTIDAPYINIGVGLTGKPGNLISSHAIVDMSDTVDDATSIRYTQELYHKYHLAVGVTSGMAYAEALRIASATRNANIVFIAPDGRESYDEYLR